MLFYLYNNGFVSNVLLSPVLYKYIDLFKNDTPLHSNEYATLVQVMINYGVMWPIGWAIFRTVCMLKAYCQYCYYCKYIIFMIHFKLTIYLPTK
jgi:hypothetical protein